MLETRSMGTSRSTVPTSLPLGENPFELHAVYKRRKAKLPNVSGWEDVNTCGDAGTLWPLQSPSPDGQISRKRGVGTMATFIFRDCLWLVVADEHVMNRRTWDLSYCLR